MSVGYRHRGFGIAQILWALFATACASAPAASPPATSVRLEPATSSASVPQNAAPQHAVPAPLPSLPTSSGTLSDGDHGPRIQNLDVNGQELGTVVRALATSLGMQYQVDAAVSAHKVNARIRNQTLSDAMTAIIPQGVTYEITNRTLRVGPARVETRIFTIDYVALSRIGTASTVIQRRIGNQGGQQGGGFGNSQSAGAIGGGADVITAVSVANVWQDVRIAVEGLVFEAAPATGPAQSAGDAFSSGGGTGAFSRALPDGRRLIINPMAGTIAVSAYPATLALVESYIRSVESSIQRQVLIEAKIVEVNLEQSFEFGIDWNVLASAGTSALRIRSAPAQTLSGANNVQFTLTGGPGEITAVLNALQTQGNVRVLSSPRVSALNNQRAVFNVTQSEVIFNTSRTPILGPNGLPITTETSVTPQQIAVGIVLDVLPQIGADNTVTMNIRPVVTSVARRAEFVAPDGTVHQAPVIDTRESDTMARLRAGETIIIGGLMQNRNEKVRTGVPVLSSIPLLGRLFTSYKDVERKAELVIFLTPTIISGQPPLGR